MDVRPLPLDPAIAARPLSSRSGPDLDSYDHVVLAFSGGKDSLACLLHLLDLGVDPARIELWHHDVDGREGPGLMDWPVTPDYCRQVARAFGLPIYFSWKEGGFEREMLRDGDPTAPTWFETPDGLGTTGGKGRPGTRRKFPQVSADLKVRWCSAYLKIDVGAAALRNQDRFKGSRTLFVTGERAEESAARSRYKAFEPHRTHGAARHVDHWRPVLAWTEAQVWRIIEAWRVNPHPAYRLGWGRLSCATCIFCDKNQAASAEAVLPAQFIRLTGYETDFGVTIKRGETLQDLADKGTPYDFDLIALASAVSAEFLEPVFLQVWTLPPGAFGDAAGPV